MRSVPERRDVLVVGGGPGGATTAGLLARQGWRVLLLEKQEFPREKACAEYASPALPDVLGRLGCADLLDRIGARPLIGMEVFAPGGASVLVTYPDQGSARTAFGLHRAAFDRALVEWAESCGARVCLGVTVRDLCRDERDGWRVRAVDRDRGEVQVSCRLLVGADGRQSIVSRRLGLDRPVRWPRRLGLVAHYAGVAVPSQAGEMHVGRGLYCGLAPLGGDVINVGVVIDIARRARWAGARGAEAVLARALSELPAVAARLATGARTGGLLGVQLLARRVARVSGPGFLLVGDAAGFLDPFTGEGIYRAMRGAELAAELAGDALGTEKVPAAGLQDYARRRADEFGNKDRLAWLLQLFLAAPPLLDYAVRRLKRRGELCRALGQALGDYQPAGPLLRPGYLGALLRP